MSKTDAQLDRALESWPLTRSLSAATRRALKSSGRSQFYARGEWLLEGGAKAERIHLLMWGLTRELYVTTAGVEHTRAFVAEGALTGSLLDLLSGRPSITWIQALEDTHTVWWRYQDFDALTRQHRDLELLARSQAEALAVRKTRREFEMLALSAAERLECWRAQQPALDGRINRRLLASYLGISPVHLSRITRALARSSEGTARETGRGPR